MADDKWETPDGLPPWEWRAIYRQSKCFDEAAARAGVSGREAAETLLSLPFTLEADPNMVHRLLPEDLGLSPLGCAECGVVEIDGHPCPDCGHDPRDAKRAEVQKMFLDILERTTGPVPEGVLWRLYEARTERNSPKERQTLFYLYELERQGLVEWVDRYPATFKLADDEATEQATGRQRAKAKV